MGLFRFLFQPRAYHEGYLQVSGLHRIFFREFGNPKGKPVICFHGGPGYWSNAGTAENFNLKKFRVILFDQRGCGKSCPLGEMRENTTADLVEDAARLLDYLNVTEKAVVFGGSWGSTLALLFAEKYPERTERLVVSKIFLCNQDNFDWELVHSGLFYPDMLGQIQEGAAGKKNIAEYYAGLINSGDLKKQLRAVNLYGSYENVLGRLAPKLGYAEVDETLLASCRVMMNYAANRFFLKENEIMDNIHKIKDIPTAIVHNRLDMVCPLKGAWQLHQVLPKSTLRVVPAAGHSGKMISRAVKEEIAGIM